MKKREKSSPRRFVGRSHHRDEGEWVEEKLIEAIVTDTQIAVDIDSQGEDGNRETVTIRASSGDNGRNFSGIYRYARNSYPPGIVELKKYESSDGYVFSGLWIAEDGDRDFWIIELESLED